jgi:hypothetical protein
MNEDKEQALMIHDLSVHAAHKMREANLMVTDVIDSPVIMAFVNLDAFYLLTGGPAAALMYLAQGAMNKRHKDVDVDAMPSPEEMTDTAMMAQLAMYCRLNGTTKNWGGAFKWARDKFREIEGRHEKFDGMDDLIISFEGDPK